MIVNIMGEQEELKIRQHGKLYAVVEVFVSALRCAKAARGKW